MGIRLTPKFNLQIDQFVQNELDRINNLILDQLINIGENFVRNARNNGDLDKGEQKTYNNHTGNLRSSIGYVIAYDGEIIEEDYREIGGGKEGVRAAERLAESAADGTKGFQLIVVAGMGYAASVESKGYDVLSGASLIAKEELKEMIQFVNLNLDK